MGPRIQRGLLTLEMGQRRQRETVKEPQTQRETAKEPQTKKDVPSSETEQMKLRGTVKVPPRKREKKTRWVLGRERHRRKRKTTQIPRQ